MVYLTSEPRDFVDNVPGPDYEAHSPHVSIPDAKPHQLRLGTQENPMATQRITHQFIIDGMGIGAAQGWGSPAAKGWLAELCSRLNGYTRTALRVNGEPSEQGTVLYEAWLFLTAGNCDPTRDLAEQLLAHVRRAAGKEAKAARIGSAAGSRAYQDALQVERSLTAAAQERENRIAVQERRTPQHVDRVTARLIYDDDAATAIPSTELTPGSDDHVEQIEGGSVAADDALIQGMVDIRRLLTSVIDDDNVDRLFDGIASRLMVTGQGAPSKTARAGERVSELRGQLRRAGDDDRHQVAIALTIAEIDRRGAVSRAAETIARDRALGGGADDTLAAQTDVDGEVVRLATRLLLGWRVSARRGGDATVFPGVAQLIADGEDPWSAQHIVNVKKKLEALAI